MTVDLRVISGNGELAHQHAYQENIPAGAWALSAQALPLSLPSQLGALQLASHGVQHDHVCALQLD